MVYFGSIYANLNLRLKTGHFPRTFPKLDVMSPLREGGPHSWRANGRGSEIFNL